MFSFEVDKRGEEFALGIVAKIVQLFGFSEDEALERVNRQFSGLEIIGRDDPIYSEPVTFWAKDIVYGHDTMWWKDENCATPLPYVDGD